MPASMAPPRARLPWRAGAARPLPTGSGADAAFAYVCPADYGYHPGVDVPWWAGTVWPPAGRVPVCRLSGASHGSSKGAPDGVPLTGAVTAALARGALP
jgi:hypothetical protein